MCIRDSARGAQHDARGSARERSVLVEDSWTGCRAHVAATQGPEAEAAREKGAQHRPARRGDEQASSEMEGCPPEDQPDPGPDEEERPQLQCVRDGFAGEPALADGQRDGTEDEQELSLIHISEPTRP